MKIAEGNNTSKQYKNATNFIQRSEQESIKHEGDELIEAISSKVYARFVELINAGLWSSELNPIRTSKGSNNYYEERDNKINAIMEEMSQILNSLDVSKGIKKDIIENLEKRISKMSGTREEYVAMKADWAEELATVMFNQDPNLSAIKTGNIIDAVGNQLIEDIMAFSSEDLKIPFPTGPLEVSIKARKDKDFSSTSVKNLDELFKLINNSKGITIKISDPLYNVLKEAAAIMGQVKSGQDQPILTTAKRNAISLAETGFSDFQLWQLYTIETPNRWFKSSQTQSSKTLEAYTNYFLSKAIAQTNLYRNQVYFTKDGIISASRFMEINHYFLKFNPSLNKLYPNIINQPHTYQFHKVNEKPPAING